MTANDAWNKRAALSAPQPTEDERVAEHMRLVESAADDWAGFILHGSDHLKLSEASFAAVKQSASALLSASQDDAEHAAMYRWLRERGGASWRIYPEGRPKEAVHAIGKYYDEAVRSAMKEKKA